MVRVAGNFQAEAPLSPRVMGALIDAFSQGWSDPRKLSQSGARARILQNQCVESISAILGALPQEIEILGEPNLGHFYAIAGFLTATSPFFYSAVDRKEIHALARTQRSSTEMSVNRNGQIQFPLIGTDAVLSLQAANGETGIVQDLGALAANSDGATIVCDYSSAGSRLSLPDRWDSAFFEAKSWQGPQGVGILAIKESSKSKWRNPLPHLDGLRTPSTYSLPLLMAATIALEEFVEADATESEILRALTQEFRSLISSKLENCDIAGGTESNMTLLPHITSLSFLYVEGEELLRSLEKMGFSVDSGSACTAEDLQPSHVLAAMGLLTHGNIRVTFHQGTQREEMLSLAKAIIECVTRLRQV